ncbi:DUF6708 domain-containing protein [Marinobacterium lutimaris]|uniref:DUF6708 domain-containing protein n=1 Tax=Marinobacterium lutimaris TaxID=568106 RepID=A0A1H5UFP0_9GAMM|nr:DUF6708 domain-containing protein [Marinobacterium lutimaris]SEF73893.1 hypothetical protein SAMN05444390_101369 [Marinobacterium lutimaris]
MDYAGLDYRNIRFSVDRSLTKIERKNQYSRNRKTNAKPTDFLSVIEINSNYIDLVDRWYSIKGFNTWLGACVVLIGFSFATMIAVAPFMTPIADEPGAMWFMLIFLLPVSLLLAWGGWWLIRTECGRYTHYPMRLNRKTGQVHFFRQNGTVLTVPWDSLFITLGEAKSSLTGTTYDLRVHVLDLDGKTVRESFSLGYPSILGNAESIDRFWAFIQPYMEAHDGIERTWQHLKQKTGYLLPIEGRKEGWRWSIVQNYAWSGYWPWLQLIASPVLGLNAIGRMIAMWSCKQPEWPAEVERESTIDVDDSYVLTWRDNGPLGWWELWYPLICTVLGIGTAIGIIGWMFYSI